MQIREELGTDNDDAYEDDSIYESIMNEEIDEGG